MINSENSSIDELLTIDTIKNNILPKYSIYNADINTVKIKDTTKQRAVFKINYNNNCYCIKRFIMMKQIFYLCILLWNGYIETVLKSQNFSLQIMVIGLLYIITCYLF